MGMATYAVLNVVFLSVLLVWLRPWRVLRRKAVVVMGAHLLWMTALFDSLIIAYGIVDYDVSKILDIYIGKAPIEDFFYTVAAVVLVPALWRMFGTVDTDEK